MAKLRRLILVAGALAIAGGLVWAFLHNSSPRASDPVFSGHPLHQWLDGSFVSATASLDSNAVPFLAQALRTREGMSGRAYNTICGWIDIPRWLEQRLPFPNQAVMVRFNSCQFLNRLGASARPAIPDLIRVLREEEDQNIRAAAVNALSVIANPLDKTVQDALTAATADPSALVKNRAAAALSLIAPQAAAATNNIEKPPDRPPSAGPAKP